MKSIHPLTKMMCAVACAVPLLAMAQTSPAPANVNGPTRNGPPIAPAQGTGDSAMPRSTMEKNSTTENSQAKTYPDTTSATDDGMDKSKVKSNRSTGHKAMHKNMDKSGGVAPAGDEPTYPAKTKDGRATSDSSSTLPK